MSFFLPTERRGAERIPCYLIARIAGSRRDEDDGFGTVRNISGSGAMIETENPVEVGAQIDLAFWRINESRVWEGRGRVVWSRRREGKTFFGMQFTQPFAESLREIL